MNAIVSAAAVASAIPSAGEASQVTFAPELVGQFERANERYREQRLKDREGGGPQTSEHCWDEIDDELYALGEAIMKQVPRSLADLALQASVTALTERGTFHGFVGPELAIEAVLKNICTLAGSRWPLEREETSPA